MRREKLNNEDKFEDRFKGLPSKVEYLPIDQIKIPELRLSSSFSDEELDEFHASISVDGVKNPIRVIRDEEGNNWLADGRHRLEALKKMGHKVAPCIVVDGTYEDAVLESALLNIHRGKANPADLALYVKGLRDKFEWSLEKTADKLRISKGYISKLLKITEYDEVLEKLRNGELSVIEAYEMVKGFMMKPISSKKASIGETSPNKAFQGLSDRDLGVTESLKEAMEKGERFEPVKGEGKRDYRKFTCVLCGKRFRSKEEVAWLPVHKEEESKAIDVLESFHVEGGNSYLNLEGEGGEKSDE
jgi:ParB/RepB/Spo0J family partition protein